MARLTLDDLKTQTLAMADLTSAAEITSTEVYLLINQALAEFWNDLVSTVPDSVVTCQTSVSVTAGTESYNLPDDFLLERAVMLSSGGYEYALSVYRLDEKTDIGIAALYGQPIPSVYNPAAGKYYKILGSKLWVYPKNWSGTVYLYYVPQLTPLATGASTLSPSASLPYGVEDYIISKAVAGLKTKKDLDPSAWLQKAEATKARLIEAVSLRSGGVVSIRDSGFYNGDD